LCNITEGGREREECGVIDWNSESCSFFYYLLKCFMLSQRKWGVVRYAEKQWD
jgi:hypothetical protein